MDAIGLIAALLIQPSGGEAALATALEGRVAGPAEACIEPRLIRRSRVIAGTAIIYEMSYRRWYVQRPKQNANLLNDADRIVSRSPLGSLCRTDVIDFEDRSTYVRTGFATLGDFIPYDRVR